jgi:hypothetical protein
MISASRDSENINDCALVAMLGLLGLRIFEATGADMTPSETCAVTGFCVSMGKATRSPSCRCHQLWGRALDRRSTIAFTDLCSEAALESGWTGTAPPDG